jgi:hypothetical protein
MFRWPLHIAGLIAIALITSINIPRVATGLQISGSRKPDRAALTSLVTELRADERRDLKSVFVSIDGAAALEEYFNGDRPRGSNGGADPTHAQLG